MSLPDANSPERNIIFRPGTHRAQNGRTYVFSEADVAAIAASYDPAVHQAPYVLGHPKTDGAPAWGWINKLEIQDGNLIAIAGDVDVAFAEGVKAGRYRFRSADLYAPNDPANPKPGQYHLRSVGWLGAEPPAIKGLGAAFSETAEAEPLSFAEADMSVAWLAGNVAEGFRGLRDWILGKFGKEAADLALPSWTDRAATQIAADIRAEARAEPGAAFAEGDAPATIAEAEEAQGRASAALDARAAELDAREAAVADREAKTAADQVAFAEGERQAARSDDATFVDGLVAGGRLPPAAASQVKTLLGRLAGDTTISFAEGADDGHAQFRQLLEGLGQSIVFAEVAPSDGVRFAENPTAEQVADQIRDEQAKASARGENLSASQAAARLGR